MSRRFTVRLAGLALLGVIAWFTAWPGDSPTTSHQNAASIQADIRLPSEALETLELILRDGPFPYSKDSTTFFNREGLLPKQARGYYREYTVPTPGARDRGARRIVTGGKPPEVFYYTADHYRSFHPVEVHQ